MFIGAAFIPMLKLSYMPSPVVGKNLTIQCSWGRTSARVIEQEVISRIESVVSTVVGIESISSTSNENYGSILITLKKDVNISVVRFEISSLLKQLSKSLPEGASEPQLNGGDTNKDVSKRKHLLSYVINADMSESDITKYVNRNIKPIVTQIEGVSVGVSGAVGNYIDIECSSVLLGSYGVGPKDVSAGIKAFLGKKSIVGDIYQTNPSGDKERITILLSTNHGVDLGSVPIIMVEDRMVYLRDVAKIEVKKRDITNFYRINGMNTINMNIHVDAESNIIALSDEIQAKIEALEQNNNNEFYITLTNDAAKEIKDELYKLIRRTFLSLLILFVFVYLASRSIRYLAIIAITLLANVLISIILYHLFGVELHLYSLAGIAVSFGIIIDTSIVMVDHYSYYRNRSVFIAILAALLTTIGSLVIIFFMPDYIKKDLIDFSVIIIINLVVSLFVSLLFVPPLIERTGLTQQHSIKNRGRIVVFWNRFYIRYISFTQKHKWIYISIFILAFGIPVYLLPSKLGDDNNLSKESRELEWYETLYNETIGGKFYQQSLKDPLGKAIGGTMRLFSKSLSSRTYSQGERKIELTITAKLTEGGNGYGDAALLNQRMRKMDNFLSEFDEIDRFETRVTGNSGSIKIKFKDEFRDGPFPSILESQVIGEALNIGGVDWATYGVSERGFSNSLNLDHKSHSIEFTGYNYDELYRYAERISKLIENNNRAADVSIEDGSYRQYGNATQKGLSMKYDMETVTLYGINLYRVYNSLNELLYFERVGSYSRAGYNLGIEYKSSERDKFDVWNLFNSYLTVDGKEIKYSQLGDIQERNAKRTIAKKNQEYTVSVAFNLLGSYQMADRFTTEIIDLANSELPVGFRADNRSYGWYNDKGEQYWLIIIIVIIIFFTCSILFESLRQPFVIISLIPISFIGTFFGGKFWYRWLCVISTTQWLSCQCCDLSN